ncbi:hypothetical protein EHW66_15400 [Erwinia psidii]|uniref:hypothetical protein n=1 Tax=Erwinia psidii TaxID=69224 RepID=UPI00226B5001|nr:hypothetical protein [Erwinia psidii]MCX8966320.1 hypothetical protein [Erwinia psidii]
MTETEKKGLPFQRVGKFGQRIKRILQLMGILVATMVIALGMAHWGVNHPSDSAALRDWMQSTRYGWLVWRLALYVALAWVFRNIWHTPGCKPAFKKSLKRMAIACAVFALACEYSLFGGGLSL